MSKVYPQSFAEPYVSFGLAKTTDSSIQLLAVSGKSVYVDTSWVLNSQPVWDGSIASIQNNAGNHGAVPGSLCYVYAYVNSGSLQLEVSDHTYTATAGYAHKVGNTSRALVGSVYFGVAGKILSTRNFAETVSNQGVSTFPPVDNEAYALRNGMYEKIQQSNLPHLFVELNQRTFATPILDGGTLSGTTYTGTAGGSNPSVSKLTYPKGIGAFPDASNAVKQHTGRFIVNVSDIPTEGKSVYLEVRDGATTIATVKLIKTASGFTLSIVTPLHNETVSTSASLSYVVELSPSGIILKTFDNPLGKFYAFNLESTELVLNLESDGTSFPIVDIDQDLTSSWYSPTVKYPLLGDTSNTDRDILTKYAAELQSITPCLLSVLDTGSLLGTQFLGVADSKFKDGAVLDYAYGAFVLAPAGGIPDAPSDGKQYARKDGDWEEVTGGAAYEGLVTVTLGTGGDYANINDLSDAMASRRGKQLTIQLVSDVSGMRRQSELDGWGLVIFDLNGYNGGYGQTISNSAISGIGSFGNLMAFHNCHFWSGKKTFGTTTQVKGGSVNCELEIGSGIIGEAILSPTAYGAAKITAATETVAIQDCTSINNFTLQSTSTTVAKFTLRGGIYNAVVLSDAIAAIGYGSTAITSVSASTTNAWPANHAPVMVIGGNFNGNSIAITGSNAPDYNIYLTQGMANVFGYSGLSPTVSNSNWASATPTTNGIYFGA